jgi:hypothetical protein
LPCNNWGSGNDVIYTFQVAQSATWVFEICEPFGVFFRGSMQLRSGGACPGGTCLDADDGGCTGCANNPVGPGLQLVADLVPGTQYWLIVDAKVLYDPQTPGTGGVWTLTYDIAPGGCGDGIVDGGEECDPPDGLTCDGNCQFLPGNDCADPIVVDLDADLPFQDFNQTCGRQNDYAGGTCISGVPVPPSTGNFTAGDDIIYELTTARGLCVDITVDADIENFCDYIGFAVDEACPPDLNCAAQSAGGCSQEQPISFLLLDPGTYYLIIDNWAPPACIPSFQLDITECPTAGACCVGQACTDDVESVDCADRSFPGMTCAELEVCPPPNDLCADAQNIGEGSTAFDTAGATPDSDAGEACTFPLLNEVWFHYTAGFSGPALIHTCGPNGDDGPDTVMEISAGCVCPPAGATLACVNDTPGCGVGGDSSLAVVEVLQGTCYTVRLSGFFKADAAGELTIEPFDCDDAADCGDFLPDDGVRDDPCRWYSCSGGFCGDLPRATQADLGGSNGACLIDGACDGNDRFHALNCFSNTTTMGTTGYPCAASPPAAVNVDAGSPNLSCELDGVCDGNDAFHALNCFSNVNSSGMPPYPCGCSAPQPQAPPGAAPPEAAGAGIILRGPRAAAPGSVVDVDVFLDRPANALRGYQLHLGTSGGRRGSLQLIDIAVRPASRASGTEAVFAGLPYWSAFNVEHAQMVAGLDDVLGAAVPEGAYLATFTYRVSEDSAGSFVVDLRYAPGGTATERTFLFGAYAAPLPVTAVTPARILVRSPAKPAAAGD